MNNSNTKPDLIRLLNASSIIPYRICLERPGNFTRSTYIQYVFKCEPIVKQSHEEVYNTQYRCDILMKKIPKSKAGMQYIELEVCNRVYLVKQSDTVWLWYCNKLNRKQELEHPIALACIYLSRVKKWKIAGTYSQINSLFTLNTFGEGMGVFSNLLAENHYVEFYQNEPVLSIRSTFMGKDIAYTTNLEDGNDSYETMSEDDEDLLTKNNDDCKITIQDKNDIFEKWKKAVNV